MLYVRFKEIDGFKIFLSFEPPSVDPVQTAKTVDPLMAETDEHKHMQSLSERFGKLERRRQQILGQARLVCKDPAALDMAQKAYEDVVKEQQEVQQEAAEYKPQYQRRHLELTKKHIVRFYTPGCQEITQEQKDELTRAFALLEPGQLLTVDGHVLTDRRGEVYWYKDELEQWIEVVIKALDDEIPAGAKSDGALTYKEKDEIAEQKEVARIAALNDEDREREKQALLDDAPNQAVTKRSQYEIEKRADPLSDAQKWLTERTEWIENRYQI